MREGIQALAIVLVVAAVMFGISSLGTEERVIIASWLVWTWPRRLVRAYKYVPRHRRPD